MSRPHGCPAEIYKIMMQCWKQHPGDRPPFSEIVTWLFKIWRSNVEINGILLADGGTLYLDEWRTGNARLDSLGESGIGMEDYDALLEIVTMDLDAEFDSDSVEVWVGLLYLSLPRVINVNFLLQPRQKYCTTQYGELGLS